jgi:hypothetical protein
MCLKEILAHTCLWIQSYGCMMSHQEQSLSMLVKSGFESK